MGLLACTYGCGGFPSVQWLDHGQGPFLPFPLYQVSCHLSGFVRGKHSATCMPVCLVDRLAGLFLYRVRGVYAGQRSSGGGQLRLLAPFGHPLPLLVFGPWAVTATVPWSTGWNGGWNGMWKGTALVRAVCIVRYPPADGCPHGEGWLRLPSVGCGWGVGVPPLPLRFLGWQGAGSRGPPLPTVLCTLRVHPKRIRALYPSYPCGDTVLVPSPRGTAYVRDLPTCRHLCCRQYRCERTCNYGNTGPCNSVS